MGTICVNRSGRTFNVTYSNAGGDVIATIAPNQVVTWLGSFPGDGAAGSDSQRVYCRGNNGTFVEGWVGGGKYFRVVEPLTYHSLYDVDLDEDGRTDSVFKTRRAVNVYNSSGGFMQTIPAGYMITTNYATSGEQNKYWMHINSFGKSGPMFIGDAFIDIWTPESMDFNMFPLIGTLR